MVAVQSLSHCGTNSSSTNAIAFHDRRLGLSFYMQLGELCQPLMDQLEKDYVAKYKLILEMV